MKRTTTHEKRIVPALTNPRPNFASLVRHGANQRPFHTVKRAGQAATQETDMPKHIAIKADAALKIHRILFNAAEFGTEDAVKGFLTEKGYSEFTITAAEGGGFMVEDNAADAFKELRTVPHSSVKGVSYVVGEPKDPDSEAAKGLDADVALPDADAGAPGAEGAEGAAGAGDAADTAKGADSAAPAASGAADATVPADDAAKTVEPRQRTRYGLIVAGKSMNRVVADYEAFAEHTDTESTKADKSFASTLASYTGGMPPGMYDMADALMGELRTLIKVGDIDEKKVATLASDFTRGVMAMHAAFTGIMATAKSAQGASPDMEALDALLDMLFADKSTKDAGTDDTDTAKLVQDTLTALSEKTDALQKAVDGMTILMIEQSQVAAKGEQVQEPARVIPARKSAELDDAAQVAATKATAAEAEDTARRTAKRLGMNVLG